MNTPYTATHCFYQPSTRSIIDTATDENPPRGHYSGETLEKIQIRYPGAVYINFDEACDLKEKAFIEPVEEITKKDFLYFLEVLPPVSWKRENATDERESCESFKMSERTCGNITGIFARIGKRYFSMKDNIRTPHAEIIRRCEEYLKGKE